MKTALDVHRTLLAADVPHEMVRLRTAALGADDLPRALGVASSSCVVVRCYVVTASAAPASLCGVLLRSGDTPDPGSLLTALDAEAIRPAVAAEVNAATGYASALVSPVPLPAGVLLLADAALGGRFGRSDLLYAPTGEAGVALGIRLHHLLVASGARVTTLTARPLAAEERLGWPGSAGQDSGDAPVLELRRLGSRATSRAG